MNTKKRLLQIAAAVCSLTIIVTVTSCSSQSQKKGETLPDTGYAAKDCAYTAEISDGVRSVTLDTVYENGVVTACVTYPEELTGIKLICDATGTGIITSGDTLMLSPEGSAGLKAVFEALRRAPTEDERVPGTVIRTDSGGFSCALSLGADGYPLTMDVTRGSYKRCVRFSDWR